MVGPESVWGALSGLWTGRAVWVASPLVLRRVNDRVKERRVLVDSGGLVVARNDNTERYLRRVLHGLETRCIGP